MYKHPNHFQLGRIVRTHGLAGDLICTLDTDKPQAYIKLKAFFLEVEGRLLPYFIKKITLKGNDAVVSLEGIIHSDQATKLKGAGIFLPLDQLPKPTKDEFYLHDLTGCVLVDENLGEIGVVESIIETGGQDLLSIQYKGKEVLVPFVKHFVTDIDIPAKKLTSHLPEGLLDIYLEEKAIKDDGLEEE
jgi:16S rRNA processing protein RimM